MKHVNYFLSLVVLISFLGFISCGGDDNPGPSLEEQQLENLAGTWSTGSVSLNDNPAPGDWSSFTITFTAQKGVSVAGDPTQDVDIFAISSYDFVAGGTATNFTLQFNGDPNETAVINISGNSMRMSFDLEEGDKLGAKVLSVEGEWDFDLTK